VTQAGFLMLMILRPHVVTLCGGVFFVKVLLADHLNKVNYGSRTHIIR
jgi:hypothetical protein